MGQMSDLLGDDRRDEYKDFVERYEKGAPPYDDISREEVLGFYREAIPNLKGDDYRRSVREIFSRMEPEKRTEFGRQLRDLALQQSLDFPGADEGDECFEDPDYLTQVTEWVHREQPDTLVSLLDDGGAGLMGGMMGGGMTGGEGASGEGGMLGNPIAKTIIVGVAAAGIKRTMEEK